MGIKSRYREKPATEKPLTDAEINEQLLQDYRNPAEPQLNEPSPTEPSVEPEIPLDEGADNEAVAEAMRQQQEADAGKNRLLEQLEAVKRAEQMQRQRTAPQPQTREQWVAALQAQAGVTEREANFLIDRPQMLQNQKALSRALADITEQGLRRDDSEEFFQAVEERFNHHLERRQRKAAAKAASEPVPEFFQPAPPPPEPPATNSAIFSAPVSREVRGAAYRHEPSPNSVRLTAEEQQIARASGISDTEYARQKLRMLKAQQAGIIQK